MAQLDKNAYYGKWQIGRKMVEEEKHNGERNVHLFRFLY